jgi:phenazine biosynthesis protein phzE
MNALLQRVLDGGADAYALLHRPGATAGPGRLDVLVGRVARPPSLAAALGPEPASAGGPHTLLVVPYRQIAERGFACTDDGSPLIAMTVTERSAVRLDEALPRLPGTATPVRGGRFDPDDRAYAGAVRRVVEEVIGRGEGANFVIARTFRAEIGGYGPGSALAFFRRLLERESGAYWTFLVHTGARTFVGASPERHVALRAGRAVMNPISGTYRYPPGGPTLPGLLGFLADRKEADELYMVVDEELKMMARVCPAGGRVRGPYLKEMARLAHTEYLIEGRTDRAVHEVLRETMFAPTVTGSPLENACRVIARHEASGRGYYGGFAALLGSDRLGRPTVDSAILIRTADIDPGGRVRIGVGATLVRHSDPEAEAAETRAKAAGLLAALAPAEGDGPAGAARPAGMRTGFAGHPEVRGALARRNEHLARFWLRGSGPRAAPPTRGRVLVVDAEDTFTGMLGHQLHALGLAVTVRRFDEEFRLDGHDLVVLGPGPGDPHAADDPRVAGLRAAVSALLARRRPFLAVCLSHQVLGIRLGFPVVRRDVPRQGVQEEIDLFGRRERVGFYNTFVARSPHDRTDVAGVGPVEVCRDPRTGEVHALRGPRFVSLQFHPESLLTRDGPGILARTVRDVRDRT